MLQRDAVLTRLESRRQDDSFGALEETVQMAYMMLIIEKPGDRVTRGEDEGVHSMIKCCASAPI